MSAKKKSNKAKKAIDAASKKLKEEEQFYVGVKDYKDVRKKILESEKNALIMLQGFQKNIIMKEQRMMLENELKKVIQDLTKGISDFEATMPRVPKQFEEHHEPENKPEAPKEIPKEKPLSKEFGITSHDNVPELDEEKMKKFDSELVRIKDALENIDDKLRDLEN